MAINARCFISFLCKQTSQFQLLSGTLLSADTSYVGVTFQYGGFWALRQEPFYNSGGSTAIFYSS
jgi:hypothetical protein